MIKNSFKLLFVIFLCGVIAGCSKVTLANYDRVEMGMIKSDVELILGEPAQCESVIGTHSCVWGDIEGTHIKVNFIADRAAVITQDGLK
ncbi:DUF3862 domain-containing protein [Aliiglaciecola sp. M165]|uniref:DUF3862 domain-containing protein n=1 Tax=Aliiglaciecola sp. M165 TaxID=2593649 RepID=UPI00117DE70F|nr:DUF3862 domain-containing protein [Aliiglaciecola sp. M165]TRY30067.1 DUF3862 domain-containing protein [Aliiglaciecola sp. M165]